MHQAGSFNPTCGAERFGLKDLKSISYKFEALVEDAMRQGEALIAKGGALSVEMGVPTGRSPRDKLTVCDAVTDQVVGQQQNNFGASVRYA